MARQSDQCLCSSLLPYTTSNDAQHFLSVYYAPATVVNMLGGFSPVTLTTPYFPYFTEEKPTVGGKVTYLWVHNGWQTRQEVTAGSMCLRDTLEKSTNPIKNCYISNHLRFGFGLSRLIIKPQFIYYLLLKFIYLF